jgi:hypothetical protein
MGEKAHQEGREDQGNSEDEMKRATREGVHSFALPEVAEVQKDIPGCVRLAVGDLQEAH